MTALLGNQEPTFLWVPDHSESYGQEVIELAAAAGLFLDPWQQLMVKYACVLDPIGAWLCFEVAIVVSRQNGKGPHDLSTPILTTDGWTTIGEILPGQHVYGADGRPTRVVACSEVFPDLDCYEVEFTDGSRHVVAGSHLWHVRDKSTGRWGDLTTEYLASRFGGQRPDNSRMEYRYRVRCDAAPDTPTAELPIDPYLLGYWLGDGTAKAANITVGAQDRQWVAERLRLAGARVIRTSRHSHGHAWGLHFRLDARVRDGFESRCRRLGVWRNKHIPEIYLTASIEQRLALLAGLMDSDGSIAVTNRSPQVEFSTSIPALAESFHRLARSLGIRVTPARRTTSRADSWRFLWTPTFDPFEMPRKSERFKPPVSGRQSLMSITGIRRVPSVPTRCIQVARPDGVYLVGHHFTPTHNSILEALELAWLFLFGDRLITHSAHLFETSREHFLRMQALIRDHDDFSRRVRRMREGRGSEEIELIGGQRLKFMTRKGGAGRGFTGDKVVLDEAMYLDRTMMAAALPTLATRPNPQVIYTGSAGMKHSTQLAYVRKRGLAGDDPALMYAEWAAELYTPERIDPQTGELLPAKGDRPDLPETWAKVNPGFGIRISAVFIAKEMKTLGGPFSPEFGTERLGIGDWPEDEEAWEVIDKESWDAARDEHSQIPPDRPLALGLYYNPDRDVGTIGVCGRRGDGRLHIETAHRHRGSAWMAPKAVEMVGEHRPCAVVVLRSSAAAAVIEDLTRQKVAVQSPSEIEYAQTCERLRLGVKEKDSVRHLGQASLTSSVGGARKREGSEGGWRWDPAAASDAGPIAAVTEAMWGLEHFGEGAGPWVYSDAPAAPPEPPLAGRGASGYASAIRAVRGGR